MKRENDLLERTFVYGVRVIKFLRTLPDDGELGPVKYQLIKSATSVGANYEEAQGASSSRDFLHKLRIVLKESRESNYWLKLVQSQEIDSLKHQELLRESQELLFIISAIINKSGNKESSNQN